MIKEKSAPDVLDEKQATWADCTEHYQNQTGLNHSQRLRQDSASWISPLVIEPSKKSNTPQKSLRLPRSRRVSDRRSSYLTSIVPKKHNSR